MPISAAFQLALDIFDLSQDSSAARQRIWAVLAPGMDRVTREYTRRLTTHTPFYRELTTRKHEIVERHIFSFTEALFTSPFDEQWVAETKRRVEEEIQLGLDVRNRCVINQIILAELCGRLGKRRLLATSGLDLLEIAVRVLSLDTTNAVALHYNAAIREAVTRSNQLDNAIQSFSEGLGGIRQTVTSAITSLAANSDQLTGLADAAVGQANKAAAAADSTASNADQMAAAIDGMKASISHIHEQTITSASMANDALANADRANSSIQSLSDGVGKIGSVVEMISSIASQTNLLALNATIEAARAGEAGKGFAVVAAEVKSLATQTEKSTNDIADQISAIERATLHSVDEIADTGRTISRIAEAAELVAAAVNEQASVTDSISKGAMNAASNAATAADALKTVAEMIRRTQLLAVSVLESSSQLSGLTKEIDAGTDRLFDAASKYRGVKRIADLKRAGST
jgi:methyl-accepting chemotaxis protein